MDYFEPVVSFFVAYFTPMVWLEQLPKLFCFVCKSQNKYVVAFAGILNLLVVLTIASIIVKIVLGVSKFFTYYVYNQYISSSNEAFLSKHKDDWVVITGGSDGIGLEIAKKFAANKFKIVILSSNQNKLNTAKSLLESNGCPHCDTIQVDFSKHDNEQNERVEKELDTENRKIGVLINCVGIMMEVRYLHAIPYESLRRVMDVNVSSALFMTSKVLPQMHKNNKGLIVNVSSVASMLTIPYMASYCMSKRALDQLSRSIHQEYPKLNIVTLIPGAVKTALYTKVARDDSMDHLTIQPENYANSAYNILSSCGSKAGGYSKTTGHAFHQFGFMLCMVFDKLGMMGPIYRKLLPFTQDQLLGKTETKQQKSENQLKTNETELTETKPSSI